MNKYWSNDSDYKHINGVPLGNPAGGRYHECIRFPGIACGCKNILSVEEPLITKKVTELRVNPNHILRNEEVIVTRTPITAS